MNAIQLHKQKASAVEQILVDCSMDKLATLGLVERTFALADGMTRLRETIDNSMMQQIMKLQGSSLGFRTDKDTSGGYNIETVKECLIEAMLNGLYPVGNEFNIIAGRYYATKAGLARRVKEFPGLTDLRLEPGVPINSNGGAIVEFKASWKLNGVPDSITRKIPVRVNANMGADAVIGKATRKILAAVLGHLTGSEHAVADGEVDDIPTAVRVANRTSPEHDLNAKLLESQKEPDVTETEAVDGPSPSETSLPAAELVADSNAFVAEIMKYAPEGMAINSVRNVLVALARALPGRPKASETSVEWRLSIIEAAKNNQIDWKMGLLKPKTE